MHSPSQPKGHRIVSPLYPHPLQQCLPKSSQSQLSSSWGLGNGKGAYKFVKGIRGSSIARSDTCTQISSQAFAATTNAAIVLVEVFTNPWFILRSSIQDILNIQDAQHQATRMLRWQADKKAECQHVSVVVLPPNEVSHGILLPRWAYFLLTSKSKLFI